MADLAVKLSKGPLAATVLFFRWALGGALSEEIMKRFFLKKFGKGGGIAMTALFGVIEALSKKIQKGEPLAKGIMMRVIVHSYTAFGQAVGIYLSEKFDNKFPEYFFFFLMVMFHTFLNLKGSGDLNILVPIFKGKLSMYY